MTNSLIKIAELDIGVAYTNVKMTMLQRGVFKSFTYQGTNTNGELMVDVILNDTTEFSELYEPDDIVYLVNNEQTAPTPVNNALPYTLPFTLS